MTDGAAIVDVGRRVRPHRPRGGAGRARRSRAWCRWSSAWRARVAVSVDTWRAPVARAALDAGAAMVNDVSGLADEALADAVRRARAPRS